MVECPRPRPLPTRGAWLRPGSRGAASRGAASKNAVSAAVSWPRPDRPRPLPIATSRILRRRRSSRFRSCGRGCGRLSSRPPCRLEAGSATRPTWMPRCAAISQCRFSCPSCRAKNGSGIRMVCLLPFSPRLGGGALPSISIMEPVSARTGGHSDRPIRPPARR